MLAYMVAARGMEDDTFGVASSLVALAITSGSLSSLSLGHAANRMLSRLRVTRLRDRMAILIVQISFLISIAFAGLFLLFSASLVRFVTGNSVAGIDISTIAIAVFAISFGSGLKGHIWADMRYLTLLASSVVSSIALFSGYAFFTALAWPLPLLQAYCVMVVAEAAVLTVAVGAPLLRTGSLLVAPRWQLLKPVLRFSSLATLNGLIFTPVNILLVSMITASLGSEAVGRFNILVQIRNAIVFLPNGFASVVLTIMSRERRPTNLRRNSLLLGAMAGLGSLPIGIVAYLWRPAGADSEYILLLALTALTAMVIALNTNIGQAFIALGRLWIGIAANIIWSATTLGLVALSLTFEGGGLERVLVAIMMAYILHTVVQAALIRYTTERIV